VAKPPHDCKSFDCQVVFWEQQNFKQTRVLANSGGEDWDMLPRPIVTLCVRDGINTKRSCTGIGLLTNPMENGGADRHFVLREVRQERPPSCMQTSKKENQQRRMRILWNAKSKTLSSCLRPRTAHGPWHTTAGRIRGRPHAQACQGQW
jgi:hypothetical protein